MLFYQSVKPQLMIHTNRIDLLLCQTTVPKLSLITNTRYEYFNILITLIHITKLDYCMQYKSFIILLNHAYFLNPYIMLFNAYL